jgi:HSP20 family protein
MTLLRRGKEFGLSLFKDKWDKLFDEFFSGLPELFERESGFTPMLDIAETNKAFVVKVELPGITQKDIQVSVDEDMLTIQGEKRQEAEEKGKNYHRIERRYGSFSRSIPLPGGIDLEKVKANYKDGVLTIELGKKEEARSRSIQIEVE